MKKKTVVIIDLVGYSTICDHLEQAVSEHTVAELNRQIQGFVDIGLAAVGLPRVQTVMYTTGDGAIVVFDSAATAHDFSAAVHQAAAQHNANRTRRLAKRVFRIGVATGDIVMEPKPGGGFEIESLTDFRRDGSGGNRFHFFRRKSRSAREECPSLED